MVSALEYVGRIILEGSGCRGRYDICLKSRRLQDSQCSSPDLVLQCIRRAARKVLNMR